MKFLKQKKIFFVTLLLIIGILGTASTMAMLTDSTGNIVNIFKAADVNSHIEEEQDDQPVAVERYILKSPVVVNDGPSNAFIRARITISPSTTAVKLYSGAWSKTTGADKTFSVFGEVYDGSSFYRNGSWIYNGEDGFYYYNMPIAAGEETAPLFDAVVLSDNADITVYQESVLATNQYALGGVVEIREITALFDRVNR